MLEALQFEFFRNALLAGLTSSSICGVSGSLVVVNRIVFLAGGIAHAAYGGIGLSFFFGWPYMAGTVGFALVAAMVMALVTLRLKHRSDTVIGVIWALGMAIGIILLDLTPGYNVDLMSYLFGSILAVPGSDLLQMFVASTAILITLLSFYRGFLAMSYDEEFARLRGVPVGLLYFVMIGMIAVSVVITIRVVGLILVIALLTIPPFIAERYAGSLATMMAVSAVLGALFTCAGLWLSYSANLTSGAAIILVAGVCFFLAIGVDKLRSSLRTRKAEPRTP